MGNQNEEEAKHPKHGRRGEDAQDQRSEDMGPTAKKQRTEDEPLTTQVQGKENNTQSDGKITQEQHEPGELEHLLERFTDEAEAQKEEQEKWKQQ